MVIVALDAIKTCFCVSGGVDVKGKGVSGHIVTMAAHIIKTWFEVQSKIMLQSFVHLAFPHSA